jgi:hypothetical protein
VSKKVAITVGQSTTALTFILLLETRVANSIIAGDTDNSVDRLVEFWVVSYVFGEGALLVTPLVLPSSAAGVSLLGRTLGPCSEHLESEIVILRENEARVEYGSAEAVSADGLTVLEFFCIVRKCERGMLLVERLDIVNVKS